MICPICALPISFGATHDCATAPVPRSRAGADDPHIDFDRDVHRALASRFRIGTPLGHDRHTSVYVAHDVELGQRVALRVFPRPASGRPVVEERFRKEMAAVAAMDYSHIVPVYGFGLCARFLWCATRFVQGRSLEMVLREHGPLNLPRCLRIVEQVASALHYAHRRGVMHGDVRPGTVWLEGEQWALVADFAVARILHALHEEVSPDRSRATASVAEGLDHSHPAHDQRCLAVTVCRCLTGTSPLSGGARQPGREREWARHLVEAYPSLPPHVASAIERALSPDPSERFRTVLDFVSALSAPSVEPRVTPALPVGRPAGERQRVLLVNGRRRETGWITFAGVTVVGVLGVLAAAWSASDDVLRVPIAAAPAVPATPTSGEVEVTIAREPVFDPAAGDDFLRAAPGVPPAHSAAEEDPVARSPAPAAPRRPAHPAPPPAPGRLFINSVPWGHLFVDGRSMGNTPRPDLEIEPGERHLRVVREGFRPFDTVLLVAPGEQVRMTEIVLEPVFR